MNNTEMKQEINTQLDIFMKKHTWHLMHFIVTLMTGGFWLIGWFVVYLMNKNAQIEAIETIRELVKDETEENT